MKKQLQLSLISIAVASLALSSVSFAAKGEGYKGENYKGEAMAPCPQPLTLNGGFYLGADVGYDMYQAKHDFTVTAPGGAVFTTDPTISASGWAGGLFAGYGMYFNDAWYLGAEVFGAWSGASVNHTTSYAPVGGVTTTSNTAKFDSNGNVGVDVIPGMKLNPATLAYVRLGYNWADLEAQDNVVIAGAPAGSSNNNSDWQGGFHWGVGIESAFYENWSVRAEYTYTSFDNLNNSTATYSSTFKNPSDNQFMVGLLYHFV
ncbi:MAG: porin family protein [Gammaproteobacteria bacterium]|nr:porin family protein [Gammaproteobacteria bacterium]